MKRFALFFAFLLACLNAQAADYALTPNTTSPQQIHVHGPFVDNATFTVPTAGDWTFKIRSVFANAGCPTRYSNCGTYYGRVDSVQLQDSLGTPIIDFASDGAYRPSYSYAATLNPGAYRLHIVGAGAGTLLHAGNGWYFVSSTAPKEPDAISCDYLRDLLQAEGYADATIEMIIDGYKAEMPPVCVGD